MVNAKQRSLNTLRTILLENQHMGRLPHLTAVATIYQNLLLQQATDEAWQLFHKVASLPLTTQRLEVSCIASGDECERRRKRGWCSHTLVETPHTVQIDGAADWLFEKGRRIDGPGLASWWGQQLAEALGARAS